MLLSPFSTFFGTSPGSAYMLLLLVNSCKSGDNAASANDKNALSRSLTPPFCDRVRLLLQRVDRPCARVRVHIVNINKEDLLILISYLTSILRFTPFLFECAHFMVYGLDVNEISSYTRENLSKSIFFSRKICVNLLNKYALSFTILSKSINIVFISYLVLISI